MNQLSTRTAQQATEAETLGRGTDAFVATGAKLSSFRFAGGRLDLVGSVEMPSRVQYAWPHPVLRILYVACADRTPGQVGQPFFLCAMQRGPDGMLTPLGTAVTLPSRPIHVTTDGSGAHVLTAYSGAPGLTVHRLHEDGAIGDELPRAKDFDFGSSPHQVRVLPSDKAGVLVARGRKGFGTPAYVQGSLRSFRFGRGLIEPLGAITLGPDVMAKGYNPRHLDFHPRDPLVFVNTEEQNSLVVHRITETGIDPHPVAIHTTLADPDTVQPRQDGGTVHVHPNGRFVYVANRNDGYVGGHIGPSWITPDPVPVFPGGENSIAVFRIDDGGHLLRLQTEDTRGLHPRTFAIDPSGRFLVAGNLARTRLQTGGTIEDVPASLAVFAIGDDGRLTYLHRMPVDTGPEMIWWMGLV